MGVGETRHVQFLKGAGEIRAFQLQGSRLDCGGTVGTNDLPQRVNHKMIIKIAFFASTSTKVPLDSFFFLGFFSSCFLLRILPT